MEANSTGWRPHRPPPPSGEGGRPDGASRPSGGAIPRRMPNGSPLVTREPPRQCRRIPLIAVTRRHPSAKLASSFRLRCGHHIAYVCPRVPLFLRLPSRNRHDVRSTIGTWPRVRSSRTRATGLVEHDDGDRALGRIARRRRDHFGIVREPVRRVTAADQECQCVPSPSHARRRSPSVPRIARTDSHGQ